MLGFLKIWNWTLFHRKKKEEVVQTNLDNLSEDQIERLALAIQKLNEDEKGLSIPGTDKKSKDRKNEVKPSIYPSRDMVLITTESDMRLRPVQVNDDHTLTLDGKTLLIKPDRPAHIFDLNLHSLMPTRKQRIFCKMFGIPQFQTFRTFTIQQEGEMTHDPHLDLLTDDMKARFEKMLMLVGKFAEADAGAVVYEGIKGPKKWWDYIPYIIICLIVAFFLFAFQVQPNM